MTDEKEAVPETNGEENKKEETNGKETMSVDANTEENSEETSEKDSAEDVTIDLDEAIIRQVEYYFGDVNFPRDRFLREQVKLDDGWVPLQVLTRFNRLSKLTTDVEVIQKALNKSTSGLLEIGEGKIRRNPEVPVPEMNEDRRKELLARTVYAKGFPKDSTLDELLKFFKQFEEVENIIMRRYLDKRLNKRLFKGSIFTTFKTKEQANKFMEMKDVKYKDTDLLLLWQDDYLQKKQEEYNGRREKKDKKMKEKEGEKPELKLPTGTVLHFNDGHDKMTREDIRTAIIGLDKNVDIAYIDFKLGLTQGWIRFVKENGANNYYKLLQDGVLTVGDHKLALRVLEGEEEEKYLQKTVDEMTKRRKMMKSFKHKGKGNNYKGRHGKKRRMDHHEDAPPAKVKADS